MFLDLDFPFSSIDSIDNTLLARSDYRTSPGLREVREDTMGSAKGKSKAKQQQQETPQENKRPLNRFEELAAWKIRFIPDQSYRFFTGLAADPFYVRGWDYDDDNELEQALKSEPIQTGNLNPPNSAHAKDTPLERVSSSEKANSRPFSMVHLGEIDYVPGPFQFTTIAERYHQSREYPPSPKPPYTSPAGLFDPVHRRIADSRNP
jgi:hypothetical protein